VWRALKAMGWPDKNGEKCAYLHRFNTGFEVEFIVRPDRFKASTEDDVAKFANSVRSELSSRVFGSQPFVVAFCDEARTPLKRYAQYASYAQSNNRYYIPGGKAEDLQNNTAQELQNQEDYLRSRLGH